MVTGSGESNPARRITSSGVVRVALSESFDEGSDEPYTFKIPFGTTDPTGTPGMLGYFPVISNDVEYDAGDPATTSSTRTNIDDMYFIEYSMSNYSSPESINFSSEGDKLVYVFMTQMEIYAQPIPANTASFLSNNRFSCRG